LKIAQAASAYSPIRDDTTQTRDSILDHHTGREVKFGNTNRLVKRDSWPITLSKTGFTSKAGNCLVMQTQINDRPVTLVLLESWGKLSKYGDARRIKQWLTRTEHLISKQHRFIAAN
jgi:D-alanyl-D-alanine endopeptidase (penicillin-binding protein 7)